MRVWDVTTGQEVPFSPLKGHTTKIHSVAYSPDGRWLASACGDSIVRVWVGDDRRLEHKLRATTSGAMAVAFSPDGRRFATGSLEGTIRVWDVATGQPLRTLTGHTSGVTERGLQPRWAPDRLVEPGGRHQSLGPGRHEPGGAPHVSGRRPLMEERPGAAHAHGPHRLRRSSRLQPRRDRNSPRPARTARSRSGTRGAIRRHAPSKVTPWRSAPTGNGSPRRAGI